MGLVFGSWSASEPRSVDWTTGEPVIWLRLSIFTASKSRRDRVEAKRLDPWCRAVWNWEVLASSYQHDYHEALPSGGGGTLATTFL